MNELTVKTIDNWGWWFNVGEIYKVKKYPYKATKGAELNYCNCSECVNSRKGKELFDMYEVIEGDHIGSIIPVVVTR